VNRTFKIAAVAAFHLVVRTFSVRGACAKPAEDMSWPSDRK